MINYLNIFFVLVSSITIIPSTLSAQPEEEIQEFRRRNVETFEVITVGENTFYVPKEKIMRLNKGKKYFIWGLAASGVLGTFSTLAVPIICENIEDNLSAILIGVGGPLVVVAPIFGLAIWEFVQAQRYYGEEEIEEMEDLEDLATYALIDV